MDPTHRTVLTILCLMDASALYEPPFSNLHAGGPDALLGGKENTTNCYSEFVLTEPGRSG